jgi:beta-ribofuranosylaminobenzene 5'-phosphate synthase
MATVEVKTGSRLHITLIDMNGTETGRLDGGLGLMLEAPSAIVRVSTARASAVRLGPAVADESHDEMAGAIERMLSCLDSELGVGPTEVQVLSCAMTHAGLGAKTQLLLAVAAGVARCHDIEVDAPQLAFITGRGGTSGIGLHGFLHGGLILDGGHPVSAKLGESLYRPSSYSREVGAPPLLARYDFPDWPVLIIGCPGYRIHGEWEAKLFQEVCPVPVDDVRAVCQTILMKLLPAVVTQDIAAFGEGLWEIQDRRWKAFEIASQAPPIGRIMDRLRDELRVTGAGMSSWGTSIMCVDERLSTPDSHRFLKRVGHVVTEEAGSCELIVTAARNQPAEITVLG